jgi:hypothetical protein
MIPKVRTIEAFIVRATCTPIEWLKDNGIDPEVAVKPNIMP